ncbi:hypothetical protein WN51_11728 [Melipona quadrifasciata]|uniref:Uncharacterized protein n=1 Tax=Melipona quadrifasciata TaxID=166423 RepID=A0A0M9A3E1_9HYME|nr:hypothetical protein WN51_11728 [Melipona quadrifasciata]
MCYENISDFDKDNGDKLFAVKTKDLQSKEARGFVDHSRNRKISLDISKKELIFIGLLINGNSIDNCKFGDKSNVHNCHFLKIINSIDNCKFGDKNNCKFGDKSNVRNCHFLKIINSIDNCKFGDKSNVRNCHFLLRFQFIERFISIVQTMGMLIARTIA